MDYQTAYDYRFSISNAVSSKKMPPWPPDAHYRRFANERLLSYNDIIKINAWVANGAPKGDTTLAPVPPVYTNGSALGTPDLSLRIPSFTVPAPQLSDLYQCFVIPSGLLQTQFITGIEVIPGDPSIVHHVLVYQDTTGEAAIKDAGTVEPGYTSFGGLGINSNPILVAGWVPGSQPAYLPNNMGIKIYAGADLVFQIHYPLGSAGKTDSTRLNFKLSNGSLRTVALTPILNHSTNLIGGPLHIPANSTKLYQEYYQLPNLADITVLSVAPHAHLVAKQWESYGVTPANDTIPLIKINDWDFHWQGSYNFRNLLRVPKQTKLYGFCNFDNTMSNPHNPNNPPQDVNRGESTTDEMMLIYFAYTVYQPGDENIVIDGSPLVNIIDSSFVSGVEEPLVSQVVSTPQLYDPIPNPANTETTIGYYLPYNTTAIVRVFDLNGRLIDELKVSSASGFNSVKYNTARLSTGEYLYSLVTDNTTKTKRLVISK
ncbi:MAG: T9SS type A sorting domain-containing protein [Bacteroidota bacterium]